jgi:hypothetical protein
MAGEGIYFRWRRRVQYKKVDGIYSIARRIFQPPILDSGSKNNASKGYRYGNRRIWLAALIVSLSKLGLDQGLGFFFQGVLIASIGNAEVLSLK